MLAIYCRISVDRPNQKSIKEQQLLGIEFAQKKNFKYKVYIDKGISGGAEIENRPAFLELINDIEDGKVTAIYVYNQDRAERNEITWFTLANIILEKNLEFYENGILIDLDDPNIFFMRGLLSQMNALYRKSTSKRIKAILKRNVSEGKTRGILPYGYKSDESGFMVINEDEATIVKRIFQLSLSGIGTRSIAQALNDEGIPTRYNKIGEGTVTTTNKYTGKNTTTQKKAIKWAGNTIRGIIVNPVYKGERHFSGEIYKVANIFTEEYWQDVNEHLPTNSNTRGKTHTYNYLLKGLIRCGKCGRNFYGRTRKNKKDHYYMCSSKRIPNENCSNRSINIDFIENFIWDKLFKEELLRDEIINHFTNTDEVLKLREHTKELDKLLAQQSQLEGERQNVTKYLLKGILEETEADQQLKRIRKSQKQLETQIANTKQQIEFYSDKENKVLESTRDLDNIKKKMTFQQKQKIITNHITNIEIIFEGDKYLIDVTSNLIDSHIKFTVDRNYKNIGWIDKEHHQWQKDNSYETMEEFEKELWAE